MAGLDRSIASIRFVALIHSDDLICFKPRDRLSPLDYMKARDRLYTLNGPDPMKQSEPADRYARIAILDQTSPAPQAANDL